MNKGDHLKGLCLYDYVACVKMTRVNKKKGDYIAVGEQQEDQGGHLNGIALMREIVLMLYLLRLYLHYP